ncbi:hypothetical protein MNBD_GAMMA10-1469, partial [hydrothermal vent metagenome]
MKKHLIGLFVACTLLIVSNAQAQEKGEGNASEESSEPLNFSQALEKAFLYDQDLQAAEFQYQSTLESRGLSKAALLPQINFNLSLDRTETLIERAQNTSISQNGRVPVNTNA